jgi:hypothetical protein
MSLCNFNKMLIHAFFLKFEAIPVQVIKLNISDIIQSDTDY